MDSLEDLLCPIDNFCIGERRFSALYADVGLSRSIGIMRCGLKWLGLIALTTVLVPFAEIPGFLKEPWDLMPVAMAQTDAEILLQVEGVLEGGDSVLNDGSLYDAHTFEGRAGQTVAITLESIDFDTFLLLGDSEGNELARNDDIDTEEYNYHSFLTLTLPADGTYQVWANGLDVTSRGRYRLTVVKTTPEQAAPLLSVKALQQIEAKRLLQQGLQQFNVSQFRAAMQSWEQALAIYRKIGDRQGEGNALGNLGLGYDSLGDYRLAIDFYEQSLVIIRGIGDRRGKGLSWGIWALPTTAWETITRPLTTMSKVWQSPARLETGGAKGLPWGVWALLTEV